MWDLKLKLQKIKAGSSKIRKMTRKCPTGKINLA